MSNGPRGSANDLRRWQRRVFWSVWVTYFAYYLCRYNMPVVNTRLCASYSWTADQFGIVLSSLTFMYAIGQFVNGQLADRFGTRAIASLGVLGSVVMNLAVFAVLVSAGAETADPQVVLALLILFWGGNGFLQAMGWSPMVKAMAHWYPVSRRGKVMGVMGTCYQFGGAFASLLAVFLAGYYADELGGDWRSVFLIPAVLFAAVGAGFFLMIRNRPEDVGLPPVNLDDEPAAGAGRTTEFSIRHNVIRTVKNPHLWIVAGTFFLLDLNRYGFVNWMPAFLDDQGVRETSRFLADFKKLTGDDATPLTGEQLEKFIREIPREREIISLFTKIGGAEPLPPR